MRSGSIGFVWLLSLCASASVHAAEPGSPSTGNEAAPATADPQASYQVQLRDGSRLLGTLIEVVPEQLVVLQLPGSEIRRIPMASIAQHGPLASAASSPPTADPKASSSAPPSVPAAAPTLAHLDDEGPFSRRRHADGSVAGGEARRVAQASVTTARPGPWIYRRLRRRDLTDGEWRWIPVCSAPCQASLITDPHLARYRIEGLDVPEADLDLEDETASSLRIHIRPGNHSLVSGGVAMAVLGSISTVAGLITLFVGSLSSRSSNDPYSGTSSRMAAAYNPGPVYAAGGAAAGLGLSIVIGSIPMMVLGKTRISIASVNSP